MVVGRGRIMEERKPMVRLAEVAKWEWATESAFRTSWWSQITSRLGSASRRVGWVGGNTSVEAMWVASEVRLSTRSSAGVGWVAWASGSDGAEGSGVFQFRLVRLNVGNLR